MALFLMFFRESLEAAVICAIMFGYLKLVGRREHFKDIKIGITTGILVSLFGGILIYMTIENFIGSGIQEIIEGVSYILACGILTYMTLWVKNLEFERRTACQNAIQSRQEAVFAFSILAFLTISREGIEAVLFAVPLFLVSNPFINMLAALAGVIAGVSVGYSVYLFGKNINWKRLNSVISIFFTFLGASLLVNGIKIFEQLGWLPFGNEPVWNTSSILSEKSEFGGLLHAFIGYDDSPTSLQLIFYVGYLRFAGKRIIYIPKVIGVGARYRTKSPCVMKPVNLCVQRSPCRFRLHSPVRLQRRIPVN